MPNCEYCRQPATLTKEHLWPASLHKRLYTANQQAKKSFWLSRLQRDIPSEPQIRDVCAPCNNVTLSKLDDYICKLFDSNFKSIVERHATLAFEYDYHLLKRWLLKMSYNCARIHNSLDRDALQCVLPYILGVDLRMGRSIQLFVRLVHPQEISEIETNEDGDPKKKILIEPSIHRIGHAIFHAHGVGQKILRVVHLRSYTFYLAYWQPNGGRAEQNDFAEVLKLGMPGVKLLRAADQNVELICDGIGAWDSLKDSRNSRFSSEVDA